MGFVVEYPITMRVDNVGATLLLENTLESQLMKHIDVRHHFIQDYVEDGRVKIIIFRSEENVAYSFTNNLSNGPFESLTSGYVQRE